MNVIDFTRIILGIEHQEKSWVSFWNFSLNNMTIELTILCYGFAGEQYEITVTYQVWFALDHRDVLIQQAVGNYESKVQEGGWNQSNCQQEIVAGALIINSTGINPRDIFAVIQTLGSKKFNVNFRSEAEKLNLFWRQLSKRTPRLWGRILWSFHSIG